MNVSLREQIQYALHRLLRTEKVDFIDMGIGIRARHRRCASHWRRHLELSKEFQNIAFRDMRGTVGIFGAGSLLDVDLDNLCGTFEEVELFDADPTVVPIWKQIEKAFRPKVRGHIAEVTGSIDTWTNELREFLSKSPSERAVIEHLHSLQPRTAQYCPGFFDCTISCNLLSQIPIYWRERALQLTGNAGLDSVEISDAIESSMATLQKAHLDLLFRISRRAIVLICDSEFFYYQDAKAHWHAERALFAPIEHPGWHLQKSESWLWHIAPQYIEQAEYGVIHQVRALHLTAVQQ